MTRLPAGENCDTNWTMETALESTEVAILSRVIQPEAGGWPRSAAEAMLGVTFAQRDRERMAFLLEKAKAGELSPAEAEEAEHYRHVGRLLELLKSRAR